MTGVDAITAVTNGNLERALEWARAHGVEIPDRPQQMDKTFSYETDARDTYPTRMALIRNICDHLQSCDPDAGVVSGRLEALAEQFRRRAISAKEDGRHVEMDIWIDAETDTKRLIPDE